MMKSLVIALAFLLLGVLAQENINNAGGTIFIDNVEIGGGADF